MFEIREINFWTELPNELRITIKQNIGKPIMDKLIRLCHDSKDWELQTFGIQLETNQRLFEKRIEEGINTTYLNLTKKEALK